MPSDLFPDDPGPPEEPEPTRGKPLEEVTNDLLGFFHVSDHWVYRGKGTTSSLSGLAHKFGDGWLTLMQRPAFEATGPC